MWKYIVTFVVISLGGEPSEEITTDPMTKIELEEFYEQQDLNCFGTYEERKIDSIFIKPKHK